MKQRRSFDILAGPTLAVAIALASSPLASAQSQDQSTTRQQIIESLRNACSPYFEKLCSGVEPGGGRVLECLQNHKDELSDSCRTEVEKVMKLREQAKQSNTPSQ